MIRIVILSFVACLSVSCQTDGAWNQAYGNSRNSSYINIDTEDASMPKWTAALWDGSSTSGEDELFIPSAPVIAPDGAIVVSGSRGSTALNDGRVRCIESTGALRFDVTVPDGGLISTPAIAGDGRIVIVTQFNDKRLPDGAPIPGSLGLLCLDRIDGHVLWGNPLIELPVVAVGDGTDASHPKILGDEIFVLVSEPKEVRLHVYSLDGALKAKHPLLGSETRRGRAAWMLPPAIIAKHADAHDGPLVFMGYDVRLESVGWDPPTGNFNPDRAWLAPEPLVAAPVLSANGEHITRAPYLEIWDPGSSFTPTVQCSLPAVGAPRTEPPSLLKDLGNSHFYLTYPNALKLVGGNCSQLQTVALDRPSAATVTKTRVHVSSTAGLHTFGWGIQSKYQVVAPAPAPNWSVRQPAVGPDGTVYDVVLVNVDQEFRSQLRAFPPPSPNK